MDRVKMDRLAVKLAEGAAQDLPIVSGSLRQQGCSMIETIYLIHRAFDVSLGDAKGLVMTAEAKRTGSTGFEDFHQQLEDAIEADPDVTR
ncbi:hypothetical protein [Kribbella sp. DT2]|uniref:hypothetical protein n=1 Tax=Kribbella sp. DT2 TaxID=3393427 RepID=UPI003CEF68E9